MEDGAHSSTVAPHGGATQAPPLQRLFEVGQRLPQVPQFIGSLDGFTHALPQHMRPFMQARVQGPLPPAPPWPPAPEAPPTPPVPDAPLPPAWPPVPLEPPAPACPVPAVPPVPPMTPAPPPPLEPARPATELPPLPEPMPADPAWPLLVPAVAPPDDPAAPEPALSPAPSTERLVTDPQPSTKAPRIRRRNGSRGRVMGPFSSKSRARSSTRFCSSYAEDHQNFVAAAGRAGKSSRGRGRSDLPVQV